jgi:isopenicillin-N N-acyltransferase-like protein
MVRGRFKILRSQEATDKRSRRCDGPRMRTLTLKGTFRAMGRQFGEACREEIHQFYDLRVHNALMQAKSYGDRDVTEAHLLGVAKASIAPTEAYHPEGFEELQGIAEGAALPVEKILAMNGLTDFRDVLAWHGDLEAFGGCSSIIVQKDLTKGGHALCGQTWDLATDNMPFVLGVIREPQTGKKTKTLTTVGCLSLIGMNEDGLSVGTTNVRTLDAKPGVNYLSIIHKALSASSFDEAVGAVTEAPRAGAHYYYIVGGGDEAVALEVSATEAHRVDVTEGAYVHTNHCLIDANVDREADTPAGSSHARQARLQALVDADAGSVDLDALQRYWADTDNGENAICRDDFGAMGISTNGAVVMEPGTKTLRMCHGLPNKASWITV